MPSRAVLLTLAAAVIVAGALAVVTSSSTDRSDSPTASQVTEPPGPSDGPGSESGRVPLPGEDPRPTSSDPETWQLLVDGDDEAISTWLEMCHASGDGLGVCLYTDLSELQQHHGTEKMVAVFAQAMDADVTIAQSCHGAAHWLGQEGYALAGDVVGALASGSSVCELGYFHGVFEAWGFDHDPDTVRANAAELCEQVAEGQPDRVREDCGHGIGHAAWSAAPGGIGAALEVCRALDGALRTQCGGGATMAMLGGVGDTPPVTLPAASDVVEFCREFPDEFRRSCIGETGYLMLIAARGDISGAQSNCRTLVDHPDDVRDCVAGVGRLVPGHAELDPQRIVELCSLDQDLLTEACLTAAVHEVLSKNLHAEDDLHAQICQAAPKRFAQRCTETTLDP